MALPGAMTCMYNPFQVQMEVHLLAYLSVFNFSLILAIDATWEVIKKAILESQ